MSEEKKLRFSRRAFLKASAAATLAGSAGSFLLGCAPEEEVTPTDPVDDDIEVELPPEPEITTKFSWCGTCGANCAMVGEVVDDKLYRLKGNPDDQVAKGKLCVKGYANIKHLYDPDRLKVPLKRTNPEKGIGVDPEFVEISWDEAFELAGDAYNNAIEENGPHSVVIFSRSHDWLNRWQNAMGTPNRIAHQSICFTTYDAPWSACAGVGSRPWTLDIRNAKYLLSLGWDMPSKAKNNQAREYFEALENGAKAVVIDPRLTITASLADEWHPIQPGTDLAFCLAMINVIVNNELYDKDFVDNYTIGIDEIKEEVQEYTPAWAEEKCGIDADTIERIAEEFATTRPALIPNHKRDAGGPNHTNSWRVAYCIFILNALVGSIDREGGHIIQRTPSMPGFNDIFPPPDFPEMEVTERIDGFENHPLIAHRQVGDFATVSQGILNEDPYPVKAAFVRKYNILAFPNAVEAVEAFKKFDFVAVLDIVPSEMVQMADVVFPEPHFLETSGIGVRSYQALYPQIALREQVVDTLHDTKGFGGIVTGIAEAMGLGHYFEDVSSGEFHDERLKTLGSSWEELQESENGLWADEKPFEGRTEFDTDSGKIELYATKFEEHGYDTFPQWQPKREEPTDEYPFYYLISRPPMHKMTESQNNELLMQLYDENTLIMSEEKAQEMGIAEGDEVYVESRTGNRIKLKAELVKGMRPDCVCVEHGFGHWSEELSLAYQKGANDGDLIPTMTAQEMIDIKDPGAGGAMNDFCVKVEKA